MPHFPIPAAGRSRPAALSAAVALSACLSLLGATQSRASVETERLGPGREVAADAVLASYESQPPGAEPVLVEVPPGESVRSTLADLRSDPSVRWAAPDPIARASGRIPNDPGRSGKRGGWQKDQWHFLAPPPVGEACSVSQPCGINAPRAWKLLRRAGTPNGRTKRGRRGPIVAVIDTGVAYADRGRHRRSPDLAPRTFVRGYDFVRDDRHPLDGNGHGTHVASTIAERTNNGRFVTGLGDGLRIMPVRVLDRNGSGRASDVARGIRYATRRGAHVINLSLEFGGSFDSCKAVRSVCAAIRKAERNGVFVVGAAGNQGLPFAQMPARATFAVAASTIRGCLSRFSSRGIDVDLTAPGGGLDYAQGGSQCKPSARGPGIVQLTLRGSGPLAASARRQRFGYPHYEGTSMAAPQVSGTAALVLASRVLHRKLGHRPRPRELAAWLGCAARPVYDESKADLYGAGILNTAAALDRKTRCPELGG